MDALLVTTALIVIAPISLTALYFFWWLLCWPRGN